MKKGILIGKRFPVLFLLLAMAVVLGVATSGTLQAATLNQADQSSATAQEGQQEGQAQTFAGTVEKQSDGSYALNVGGSAYKLDDQQQAAQFDGKAVKVTGTYDGSTKTIHVQKIEEAKQ